MSEEVDNATPETSDNVAPAEAVVEESAKPEVTVPKFGDMLKYAPDEYKDSKTWDKMRDIDMPTALKVIADMDKWTGKRGDIPQDDADDATWKEFYSKIGVPEKAEGYSFAFDEATTTALGADAEAMSAYIGEMKSLGLKHNISAKALDGFLADAMGHEMSLRGNASASAKETADAAMKTLTDEWGDGFDEMGRSVQNLEKHYGLTEDEMDQVEASPIFNKLLGRIAKDLDEKGQVGNVFSQTKIGLADELADTEGKIQEILRETKGDVQDKRLTSLFERKRRLDHKLG